jgi:hypothetical protein
LRKLITLTITVVFLFSVKIACSWIDNFSHYFSDTSPSVGMSFLKLGIGARAVALGGAYSSVAKDPTAVFWNPSGVIYAEGLDMSFSHLTLMEDIKYECFALSTGDGNQGVGIGIGGVFYGNMELREDRPSEEPIGTFNAYSFLIKLSYGHRLGSDFAVGISMGGILERIYIYSTDTYTFDFGLRYSPSMIKSVVISANINNLGPMVKYIDECFKLPLTTKLGCSYATDIWKSNVTITGEISKPIDAPLTSALGVEADFSYLSLRFGYSSNNKSVVRWATGLGIKYKFLSIDYSFSPYLMDIGINQCISLNLDL